MAKVGTFRSGSVYISPYRHITQLKLSDAVLSINNLLFSISTHSSQFSKERQSECRRCFSC